MKTIIVYASVHHKNTEKLVKQIQERFDVDVVDITANDHTDFTKYDTIGFASGIYFNEMHPKIMEILHQQKFRKGQKVFLLYTCGIPYRNYAKSAKKLLEEKGANCLGVYWCRGYDTYGVLKKLGGIAKGHPNETDIQRALEFVRQYL
ncbi:MAG: flavodoxin family protein [Massiliimalia sp.]|jgi:flavodoxin